MKKILISLAATVAAVFISTGASAQGYVGLGAGPSKINVDCTGLDTCDKTSTGYKLYGGYRFANQFAVEGAYFDWGRAKATGSIAIIDPQFGALSGTGEGKVKATGFGIGVAYFVPFATDWTGVARLGVMHSRARVSLSGTGTGSNEQTTSFSGSETYTGTFPYFGFGIGYNVMPNLAITGEADFSRIKYLDLKANVQMFSVGVRYSF